MSNSRSRKCRDAALIFSANNVLTHTPSTSLKCYTEEGYEAASKGNVAFGSHGVDAMAAYIDDGR